MRDVVQANLLAMSDRVPGGGQIYNVASGATVSLLDLLGMLGRLRGTDIQPVHQAARAGDIRHSAADIAKAIRELGYTPRYSLEVGLAELLASLHTPT